MMKKILLFLLILTFYVSSIQAQVLIDEGGLTDPAAGGSTGLAESNQFFTLSGSKWDKKSLTFCIENESSKLAPDIVQKCIIQALASWHSVANISFVQIYDASKADLKFK